MEEVRRGEKQQEKGFLIMAVNGDKSPYTCPDHQVSIVLIRGSSAIARMIRLK
jgi:hypothetical protein